jgi:hypothetical protein
MFQANNLAGSQGLAKPEFKLLQLSQAIMRGCKLKPFQCFGTYSRGRHTACVIGAAEAGGFIGADAYAFLGEPYYDRCPDCASYLGSTFGELLIHLNDCHEWRRERIAQFVETLAFNSNLVPSL